MVKNGQNVVQNRPTAQIVNKKEEKLILFLFFGNKQENFKTNKKTKDLERKNR